MSEYILIDRNDLRFTTLKKGFNLRWPTEGHEADFIYICDSAEAVIQAANCALSQGHRITVRSGGHCYEGFVSNKLQHDGQQQLAIIDLGLMTGLDFSEEKNISSPYGAGEYYRFRAATGNQNWDGYVALYKKANRTIPGGSCYSVGAGGHISGGGYGLLSRLHGLTVDWLTAVDILVPAPDGKSLVAKHVHLNSEGSDRDLFIACRGAGGGNFGILLNYYFDDLPQAPQEAYLQSLSWPWEKFTKERLHHFLNSYWQWFRDNDANWNSDDPNKANGGLFTLLKLQHRSTGNINLLIQYTGIDGRVDGDGQTTPLIEFIQYMHSAAGSAPQVSAHDRLYGPMAKQLGAAVTLNQDDPLQDAQRMDWLHLTQTINGSGSNQCGKYKSVYQIGDFGQDEIDAIWQYFNQEKVSYLNQALFQIDSYGGRININDETKNPTSVYQRRSLLKSQLQVYWDKKENEQPCLEWIREFYTAYFKQLDGKPFADNQRYEGCYINYPDVDMKYVTGSSEEIDSRWLELYYGDKRHHLVNTKSAIDPNNIFRNELSIPLSLP